MVSASNVKVLVLRTAGTNCDAETKFAFESFGASVELVHINRIFSGEVSLSSYHIMALPGGFSYGDDAAAGRILANELRLRLGDDIRQFIAEGKLIIGICNGFQVLVKAGILPGPFHGRETAQTTTLTNNDSGKFEDRWVHLRAGRQSVWTAGLPETIYLPVAHGEGKFIPADEDLLQGLQERGQIAFRYCDAAGQRPTYPGNPNGSMDDIAGIIDPTGRVLGLMPHPERHFRREQHPSWTRDRQEGPFGDGAKIFENGVRHIQGLLASC